MFNKIVLILFLSGFAFPATAGEHAEIALSAEAVQNFGIQTVPTRGKQAVLPRSAFVASKDGYFVYAVDDDGGFVEIEVQNRVSSGDGYIVDNADGFAAFVAAGAKYLRVVRLSNAQPAGGHSH